MAAGGTPGTVSTGLFSSPLRQRPMDPPPLSVPRAADGFRAYAPEVDERVLEVFARAEDPGDWRQLHALWLGRVASEAGQAEAATPEAELWRQSRSRRSATADEVLSGPSTVTFIKELFNTFFRDDLYGRHRPVAKVILSGGAVDERAFGLSEVLKAALSFSLDQDWYGYSDSRGRLACREAVARLENQRLGLTVYDEANVALTLGGTFSVNALADFILGSRRATLAPALAAIPNYPPLVQAVARRAPVSLAAVPCRDGVVSLRPLIDQLRPETPLVLLQTVNNPTGGAVDEDELAELIRKASPQTMILLDECHECVGELPWRSPLRASANVVRIASVSKSWAAPGFKAGWIVGDAAVIAEYYEFASTTYGGPPSLLYLFIEVMARLERWLLEGLDCPGPSEFMEFEPHLGLTPSRLETAYSVYRGDRRGAEAGLLALRDVSVGLMQDLGAEVMVPRFSVNAAVRFPGWRDSYVCYRDILAQTGVSFLPGILTFCFSGAIMRMTTARTAPDLRDAADRLAGLRFPQPAAV